MVETTTIDIVNFYYLELSLLLSYFGSNLSWVLFVWYIFLSKLLSLNCPLGVLFIFVFPCSGLANCTGQGAPPPFANGCWVGSSNPMTSNEIKAGSENGWRWINNQIYDRKTSNGSSIHLFSELAEPLLGSPGYWTHPATVGRRRGTYNHQILIIN